MNRIKKISEEIYQKYDVIKEINFYKDIDAEKSGIYYIDRNNKYVEFLYEKENHITAYDYGRFMFGDYEITDKKIILNPELDNSAFDTIKRSHVVVKKPIIPQETSIIHIGFKTVFRQNFCIRILNQFSYDVGIGITNGSIPWDTSLRKKTEYRRTEAFFFSESFFICQSESFSRINPERERSIRVDGDAIECIFDIAKGSISIIPQNTIIFHEGLIIKDKSYLTLACNYENDDRKNEDTSKTYIEKIIYGKRQGYLYLKAIEALKNEKAQVKVIYKGNPIIQFYDINTCKWSDVSDRQSIELNHKIEFRISMNYTDRIYGIYLVEDKEDNWS